MSYLATMRWPGVGDISTQQAVGAGQSVLGAGVSVASATGTLAPMAAALGVSVPVLGAIIGAGIMAAGLAIDLIMNSGCGQTCIVSTSFANQANAAMQQNIEAFFAPRMVSGTYDPSIPLPKSSQTASLSNFDTFWAWLQAPSQCGNPQLGTAGQRCITDRQAGACTWTQPASSVPPWGVPPAGACWNWDNGYRAPIANDTNVYDDSAEIQQVLNGTASQTSAAAAGSSASGAIAGIPSSYLILAGAAILIGVGMMN